jgi:ABC-type cobalamin transport system ATPase subunit
MAIGPPPIGPRPSIGPAGTGKTYLAMAMAVDISGNVYITGESFNGTNYDYLTLSNYCSICDATHC